MTSKPKQNYEPGKGLLLYINIKIFGEKVGEEKIKDATFRRGADHDITHINQLPFFNSHIIFCPRTSLLDKCN